MKTVVFEETLPIRDKVDVIVAGGGVAGIAAALSVRRRGKSVLLLEKGILLGGLATSGLVNMFVPMCNGRGVKIIKGMCEELLSIAVKYGYDTIPERWKQEKTCDGKRCDRYLTTFSPALFALALTELLSEEHVEILFDAIVSDTIMDGGICRGLVVQTREGRAFYPAEQIIDTTGDAIILHHAGIPTVIGENFQTYAGYAVSLKSCARAVESGKINRAIQTVYGGNIDLYGRGQPEDIPLYSGTTSQEVTDYIIQNQLMLLNRMKYDDRFSRDIVSLPAIPQLRETRRIQGAYTLSEMDKYIHFDDSIGAVCDFDHTDVLYEIPYRCLISTFSGNLITAGRSVSAKGYAWDVLRVIPPAIITGQAAGEATVLALEEECTIDNINVSRLQERLQQAGVMIHFEDALLPSQDTVEMEFTQDYGHI